MTSIASRPYGTGRRLLVETSTRPTVFPNVEMSTCINNMLKWSLEVSCTQVRIKNETNNCKTVAYHIGDFWCVCTCIVE